MNKRITDAEYFIQFINYKTSFYDTLIVVTIRKLLFVNNSAITQCVHEQSNILRKLFLFTLSNKLTYVTPNRKILKSSNNLYTYN